MSTGEVWGPAEFWLAQRLAQTGLRWTRIAPSRFWQWRLGITVQLESTECDTGDHSARDRAAFYERGVMVIRVSEFDEKQTAEALRAVGLAEAWNIRRRALGLPSLPGAQ